MKYRKLEKDLPPLTANQLQERKKRRMLMRRMMFGMSQPKGTQPRRKPTREPVFKPMPGPAINSFSDQALGAVMSFIALLPGMRRRRKEAELAEQRRSDSMKAQGR